jgi:urease gamma subunit
MLKIIEVTARGFDGENDDTDNRVLWIKADSAADVMHKLDNRAVPYQSVVETDIAPKDTDKDDCVGFSELVALLFGFVVEDMRAALNVADSFMSGFEDDDMQEGIGDMLKQVRDAAMVQS